MCTLCKDDFSYVFYMSAFCNCSFRQSLNNYLANLKPRFDQVLAFEPTGWTHSQKVPSLDNIKPKINREKVTLYGEWS